MSQVHPSAIIDSRVEVAGDVYIGPGCIFEGEIRIGKGCHFAANVYLKGPLEIGKNNRFYPNTYIGFEPQDYKFDPEHDGAGTVIGKNNIFREGASVHRATSDEVPTRIGDNNMFMVNSHAGHDSQFGNDIVMVNGALCGGHVEVADKVIIGGNGVAHQNVRVGRLGMVSGVAGLTQDLPPFCVCYNTRMVGSLNIVGLRRNGYRSSIKPLKEAFNMFFKSGLPNKTAAENILEKLGEDELCKEFAEFILSTKRGVHMLDTHTRKLPPDKQVSDEERG